MNRDPDISKKPGLLQDLSAAKFALLAAGILLVMFPQVFLGGQTFFFRDYGMFGYPLAHYHRECFWRGELPLWNPLNDCGIPWMAQWNTMTFYPGALLYLIPPLPWSLGFHGLAHLVLAAVGMFQLARHYTQSPAAGAVAGTAYAFNGLMLNCLMWPNNIAAMAWMPWVLLGARRGWQEGGRRLVGAALVGTLQMLTGAPEIIGFTWLLVAAAWLADQIRQPQGWGRTAARLGLIAALVAGLSAIQLLPFMELLRLAHRGTGYSDDSWAMPPWGWANFLVPNFYTWRWAHGVMMQVEQGWTSSYYLPLGALLLALLAGLKRNFTARWFAVIALLSAVVALGPEGRLYSWLKALLPQIGMVRFPVKFVVPAVFLVPLLSGLAIAELERADVNDWRQDRRRLIGLALVLLALIAAVAAFFHTHPYGNAPVATNALVRALLLAGFAAALFTWQKTTAQRGLLILPLLAILWLDAWTHAPDQNPTVASRVYEPGRFRPAGAPRAGDGRVMTRHDTAYRLRPDYFDNPVEEMRSKRFGIFFNLNLLSGLPKLTGMFSLHLREWYAIQELIYTQPERVPAGLADFLGATLEPQPGQLLDFVPRTHPLPHVTGGQEPVFADGPGILAELNQATFNPRQAVYLPLAARTNTTAKAARVEIRMGTNSSQRIEFEAQASAPAWVVIAQSHYPAWQARVNGTATKIWPANHAFQAMEIPAGRSRIQVTYEDRWLKRGLWVTFASALALLAIGLTRKGKSSPS